MKNFKAAAIQYFGDFTTLLKILPVMVLATTEDEWRRDFELIFQLDRAFFQMSYSLIHATVFTLLVFSIPFQFVVVCNLARLVVIATCDHEILTICVLLTSEPSRLCFTYFRPLFSKTYCLFFKLRVLTAHFLHTCHFVSQPAQMLR